MIIKHYPYKRKTKQKQNKIAGEQKINTITTLLFFKYIRHTSAIITAQFTVKTASQAHILPQI